MVFLFLKIRAYHWTKPLILVSGMIMWIDAIDWSILFLSDYKRVSNVDSCKKPYSLPLWFTCVLPIKLSRAMFRLKKSIVSTAMSFSSRCKHNDAVTVAVRFTRGLLESTATRLVIMTDRFIDESSQTTVKAFRSETLDSNYKDRNFGWHIIECAMKCTCADPNVEAENLHFWTSYLPTWWQD